MKVKDVIGKIEEAGKKYNEEIGNAIVKENRDAVEVLSSDSEYFKKFREETERLEDLEVCAVKYGLCKNCKHYAKEDRVKGKNFGTCSCDKFVYTGGEHLPLEDDMLIYEDFEQYDAAFYVGENYGCIHFTEREG